MRVAWPAPKARSWLLMRWPPVLLVHGQNNGTISPIASKAAAQQLRSSGFEVELVIEPEIGHRIFMSGAAKALQFLQRQFGLREGAGTAAIHINV